MQLEVLTMGLAHAYGDAYIQLQNTNSGAQPLQFQNLTGGNIVFGTSGSGYKTVTLDNTGSILQPQNLTVSGTLQSPLTSLIGVSVSNVNNSIGGF